MSISKISSGVPSILSLDVTATQKSKMKSLTPEQLKGMNKGQLLQIAGQNSGYTQATKNEALKLLSPKDLASIVFSKGGFDKATKTAARHIYTHRPTHNQSLNVQEKAVPQ